MLSLTEIAYGLRHQVVKTKISIVSNKHNGTGFSHMNSDVLEKTILSEIDKLRNQEVSELVNEYRKTIERGLAYLELKNPEGYSRCYEVYINCIGRKNNKH